MSTNEIIFHHRIPCQNLFVEVVKRTEEYEKVLNTGPYINYFLTIGCHDGGGGSARTELGIIFPSQIKEMAIKLTEAMIIEENKNAH